MSAVPATPSSDWQKPLCTKEHQNWLGVGHALLLLCGGIRPYVKQQMKAFYTLLITTMGSAPPCTCTYNPKQKPNPWHKTSCTWANHLQSFHSSGKPKWQQSDSTKWTDPNVGYWEIAKLFMSDLGSHKASVVDVDSTDTTGLLNLMYWCKVFTVQKHLVAAVRDTRNMKWGHAAKQELFDKEKTDSFSAIIDLLKDPIFGTDKDAQDAQNAIVALEKVDIIDDIEEKKVIKEFQNFITGVKCNIEEKITALTDDQTKKLKGTMVEVGREILEDCNSLTKEVQELKKLVEGLNCMLNERNELCNEISPCNTEDVEQFLEKLRCRQPERQITFQYLSLIISVLFRVFVGQLQQLPRIRGVVHWFFMLILIASLQITERKSPHSDDCVFQPEEDPMHLREFSFAEDIQSARHDFTGRKWLYQDLEAIFEESLESPGVVLVGQPGWGKTAFISQLICSSSTSLIIHNQLLAYHICIHSHKRTQSPSAFVRSLAHMIAHKIPSYFNVIKDDYFIQRILHEKCLEDPVGCFEQGILRPLKKLRVSPNTVWFIVIDALDECRSSVSKDNGIVDIIKHVYSVLPHWLKLILTSRRVPDILRTLSSFKTLKVKSDDPRNLEDIDSFVTAKIYKHYSLARKIYNTPLAFLGLHHSDQVYDVMARFVNQSQGNFLWVKVVIQNWLNDPAVRIRETSSPSTLNSIYNIYFEREFGDEAKFKDIRNIFEVIVAAGGPISLKEIYEVLSLKNSRLHYQYDFLPKLEKISFFLRHGISNDTVSVYHASLVEWLTNQKNLANPFYVHKANGHSLLADHYMNKANTLQVKTLSYKDFFSIAFHMAGAELAKDHANVRAFRAFPSKFVNASNLIQGQTALHLAARAIYPLTIAYLCPHFKMVDCRDNDGVTPAFEAVRQGSLDNLKMLTLCGANLSNILWIKSSHHSSILSRDNNKSFKKFTLLHAASQLGHSDIVKFLLDKKVSTTVVNEENMTAAHLAASRGNIIMLQLLHNRTACLDIFTLYFAIVNDRETVVDWVFKHGVKDYCFENPNDKEGLQVNSFHFAIFYKRINILKILLKYYPSFLSDAESLEKSFLHKAIYLKNLTLVEFLISNGANVSLKCKNQKSTVEHAPFLLSQSGHSNIPCPCGYSALHFAVESGLVEMVQLVISHGLHLQTRDCEGSTALHVASYRNYETIIRNLVVNGAKVNAISFNGSTPLHSAALGFAEQAVLTLVIKGSEKYQRDANGMLPYHYIVKDIVVPKEFFFLDFYTVHPAEKINVSFVEDVARKREFTWFFVLLKTLKVFYDSYKAEDNQNRNVLDIIIKRGLGKAHKLMRTRFDKDLWMFSLTSSLTPLFFLRDKLESFRANFIINSECCTLIQDLTQRRLYRIWYYGSRKKNVNCYCSPYEPSPLLAYLETGGRHIPELLTRFGVKVPVTCHMPFSRSHLHMVAYHKLHYVHYLSHFYPAGKWEDYLKKSNAFFDYFFFNYNTTRGEEGISTQIIGDGPVAFSLRQHRRRYSVLNHCLDSEGYTPLHRAAQGANIVAIKRFLDWGANIKEKVGRYDALTISVLFSVKYGEPNRNFGVTSQRLPPRPSILSSLEIEVASIAAKTLLESLIQTHGAYDVRCKPTRDDLSIYHLAAARGMHKFVRSLFRNKKVIGLFPNCYNKYGITPLYLAKLFAGTRRHFNPWLKVIKLITRKGATLSYPDKATEHQLLRAALHKSSLFSHDILFHFLSHHYALRGRGSEIKYCNLNELNNLIKRISSTLQVLKQHNKFQPFLNSFLQSLNTNILQLIHLVEKHIFELNETIQLFDTGTNVLVKNLRQAVTSSRKAADDRLLWWRERCDQARIILFQNLDCPSCALSSFVNGCRYIPRPYINYMKETLHSYQALRNCSWQHLIIKTIKQLFVRGLASSWNNHFNHCEFYGCSNFLKNRVKQLTLDGLVLSDIQLVKFMRVIEQKPYYHEFLTYGTTPPLPKKTG